MSSTERKKMCSSCEGMIPIDAILCPYCSSALWENQAGRPTPSPGSSLKQQASNNGFSSLYTPPYPSHKDSASLEGNASVKKKTESFKSAHRVDGNVTPVAGLEEVKEAHDQAGQKSVFWAVLTLSLAVNVGILGLLQFFFSDGGILRLEWKSDYWFIYCLASLPLFYFGIKKVNILSDTK